MPPLPPLEAFPGPKGRYSTILRIIATEHPTVRQLLGRLAAGGGHCTLVGTPEQIADQMEHWFVHEGADGFNLMPPLLPEGLEDFVEQVVPVLQRRGLFRTAYESDHPAGASGAGAAVATRRLLASRSSRCGSCAGCVPRVVVRARGAAVASCGAPDCALS